VGMSTWPTRFMRRLAFLLFFSRSFAFCREIRRRSILAENVFADGRYGFFAGR